MYYEKFNTNINIKKAQKQENWWYYGKVQW